MLRSRCFGTAAGQRLQRKPALGRSLSHCQLKPGSCFAATALLQQQGGKIAGGFDVPRFDLKSQKEANLGLFRMAQSELRGSPVAPEIRKFRLRQGPAKMHKRARIILRLEAEHAMPMALGRFHQNKAPTCFLTPTNRQMPAQSRRTTASRAAAAISGEACSEMICCPA